MKVLHVVPTISNLSAGTTEAVISLCQNQYELGIEVELYTLGNIPENLNFSFPIRSFKRDTFPHEKLGASKDMMIALDKTVPTFDIVHSHILWMAPCYYTGIVASKYNIPHVCSPHGALTKYSLSKSKFKKIFSLIIGQHKSLKSVTKFHLTAYSELEDLKKTIWYKPSFITPNGINGPSLLLEKKQSKTVLFLSRIHPKKGLDILINDFLTLRDTFPDWKLNIIGPIEDKQYYKTFSDKINSENGIYYLGEISGPDKYTFMQNADIFVLPTHSENFGLVVGESLLCRTPVICTDGAPWEDLDKNNAGWSTNFINLQKTLKHAMSLPHQNLVMMGDNGRRWILNEFGWKNVALQMKFEYEKLVGIEDNYDY